MSGSVAGQQAALEDVGDAPLFGEQLAEALVGPLDRHLGLAFSAEVDDEDDPLERVGAQRCATDHDGDAGPVGVQVLLLIRLEAALLAHLRRLGGVQRVPFGGREVEVTQVAAHDGAVGEPQHVEERAIGLGDAIVTAGDRADHVRPGEGVESSPAGTQLLALSTSSVPQSRTPTAGPAPARSPPAPSWATSSMKSRSSCDRCFGRSNDQ